MATKVSTSETGHAKNIANFQNLISFCTGYGAQYNPTKESLTLPKLQDLYQLAQDKLAEAKAKKTLFDGATNDRRNAFSNLKTLSTKIINAFAVSGADALAVANAKSVNKKLQGSTSKKTTTNNTTTTATAPPPSEGAGGRISTSQQSYDRLIDHFANLIQILEQNKVYAPNEDHLKLATLKTKLSELQTKNTSLINAYTDYSNTMIARNQTLYNPLSGLVQVSKEVKQYVKSVFGATSPEYAQVSSLEFKIRKGE